MKDRQEREEAGRLGERARAAVKSGNVENAISACLAWAAIDSGNPEPHILLTDVHLKQEQFAGAIAAARRACQLAEPDPALYRRLLLLELRQNQHEAMLDSCRRAQALWPEQAQFTYWAGRALLALGDTQAAAEHFARAAAGEPGVEEYWRWYIVTLKRLPNHGTLATAARAAADRFPTQHSFQVEAGRTALKERAPDADRFIARARELKPQDEATLALGAEAALAVGSHGQAAELLAKLAAANPANVYTWIRVGDLMRELNRPEEAADAMEQALPALPDNPALIMRAAAALRRAGREEKAEAALRRASAIRLKRLPETFADGLRSIHGYSTESLPALAAKDWAWGQWSRRYPGSPLTRAEWDREVDCGARASALTFDWVDLKPERHDEIAALLDVSGLECLHAAMARGCGAMVAVAHVGAMLAVPVGLQMSGIPYAWLIRAIDGLPGTMQKSRISSIDRMPGDTLNAMITKLAGGAAVMLGADSQKTIEPLFHQAADGSRRLPFNSIASLLVFRQKAAALYCDAVWIDDRLAVRFSPLPEPAPGEDAKHYSNRFAEAYYAKVFEIFDGAPRNLICTGGFWSAIS